MINTVTEWALENEKQVVKNEKRQRVDNRPYGHTRRRSSIRTSTPRSHPYSWPRCIGSLEDLQAATLDDVREFYDRYYGANNATLVIAGDIDVEETKRAGPALVRRDPTRDRKSTRRCADAGELDGDGQVALSRRQLRQAARAAADLPDGVRSIHPDSVRTARAGQRSSVRGQTRSAVPRDRRGARARARCGRRFVQLDASSRATFTIRVRATSGVDARRRQGRRRDRALARFEERRASWIKDLARIKTEQETATSTTRSRACWAAPFSWRTYNEFAGDPGFVTEEVRRIQGVTREDVIAVYDRYIQGQALRHDQLRAARTSEELIVEGDQRAGIVEEQIVQGAERSVEADPDFEYERTRDRARSRPSRRWEPPPVLTLPEIWSGGRWPTACVCWASSTTSCRCSSSRIRHEGRPLLLDPSGQGGVAVTAGRPDVWRARADRTPEELEDAIGALGADISISAGAVRLIGDRGQRHLARNYEASVLALVEEILLEPRWDAKEFDRLKSPRS